MEQNANPECGSALHIYCLVFMQSLHFFIMFHEDITNGITTKAVDSLLVSSK